MNTIGCALSVSIMLCFNAASLVAQWEDTHCPGVGMVHQIFVDGNNLYVARNSGGLLLSTDTGTSWTAVDRGMLHSDVMGITRTDDFLYVGTAYFGVYVSTNLGQSWTSLNSGLPELRKPSDPVIVFAITTFDGYTYAGTSHGVFRIHPSDTAWTDVSSDIARREVWNFAFAGSKLYAVTHTGVFVTENGGLHWEGMNNGLTRTALNALAFGGTKLYAATQADPGPDGVFLSNDSGKSWRSIGGTIPFSGTNTVLSVVANEKYVFAGMFETGMYWSSDDGATWVHGTEGGSFYRVQSMVLLDSMIFIGGYAQGVMRRSITEMLTSIGSSGTAGSFDLGRNYPNPASGITTIPFSLGRSGSVDVTFYNVLGNEVDAMHLPDQLDGEHRISWNVRGLPAGVYKYQMSSGSFSASRTMLVVH